MNVRAITPLLLLVAGCQPPVPDTTERIIRIQIEGCEDATPLPILATPTPIQVPTKVAVVVTENPVETPAMVQACGAVNCSARKSVLSTARPGLLPSGVPVLSNTVALAGSAAASSRASAQADKVGCGVMV